MATTLKLLGICILWLANTSHSYAFQDSAPVQRVVQQFLQKQLRGGPADYSIQVSPLDPGNQLVPCRQFEAFFAPGQTAWGKTTVGVRCKDSAGWVIHVAANVRIFGEYVVSATALSAGKPLTLGDVRTERGELSELPSNVITDPVRVIGRNLKYSVAANLPIRADNLNQPTVIQAGQTVRLVFKGEGFEVSNEGRALHNAQEGQVVQVRMNNGQLMSGIARQNGVVEVGK